MTGRAWLSKLPHGWQAQRADAVLEYRKTPIRTTTFELADVFHYSIPAIQETGDGVVQSGAEIESDKIALNGGELIVSKLNPRKGCVLLTRPRALPIVCSTEFVPLVARPGFSSRYAFYVYSSTPVREMISAAVQSVTRSHQRANPEDIIKIWIPVPPHSQQKAITDYLDRETARLDNLVVAKQRLLETLAEKRRAIITHAVTRGLDSDARQAPSGITWFDEMPKHWEAWKLGHIASVGNGSTPHRGNEAYWESGDTPWLTSAAVNQDPVMHAEEFVTSRAVGECHLPMVPAGSVLVGIVGQGKTRGQASFLTIEATLSQNIAFVTPIEDMLDGRYLRWVFLAVYDFLRGLSDERGGAQGSLTCEELASLRVPVPPFPEQRAIVAHIAAETAKLDALKASAERTIALLKERRSALIAAAVTGQIDPGSPRRTMGAGA